MKTPRLKSRQGAAIPPRSFVATWRIEKSLRLSNREWIFTARMEMIVIGGEFTSGVMLWWGRRHSLLECCNRWARQGIWNGQALSGIP